jgi:predicted nucleotidyltransferase
VAIEFRELIDSLVEKGVDFVIIGGVALVLHGSSRVTQDLDICYARDPQNLERLAAALLPFRPSLRGAPPGLPFTLDARTLHSGLNFTLTALPGDIDILGEVAGVGGYEQVAADAVLMEIYGHRVQVMSLSALERAKQAAGRLKDLADLDEIQMLRKRL